jgi:hypothetical protein
VNLSSWLDIEDLRHRTSRNQEIIFIEFFS